MNYRETKNKKNLLASLLFLLSLTIVSCLNGNGYGKQEPSLPIALEAGSVGHSDTLKTLNLPDLRKPAPLEEKKERITLEGEIICLACELKKEFQANSQCEKYGHQNFLRAYDGNIYTFIENDKTSNLIRKAEYQGKIIRVIGTLFKETNIIDVISFEIVER